jgi:hypothetical protein
MVSDLYSTFGPAGARRQLPAATKATAKPAWDHRTGWGVPDGERMLSALAQAGPRQR